MHTIHDCACTSVQPKPVLFHFLGTRSKYVRNPVSSYLMCDTLSTPADLDLPGRQRNIIQHEGGRVKSDVTSNEPGWSVGRPVDIKGGVKYGKSSFPDKHLSNNKKRGNPSRGMFWLKL